MMDQRMHSSEPAGKDISNRSTPDQVQNFLEMLFEKDDVIEFRHWKSTPKTAQSIWIKPGEFQAHIVLLKKLEAEHRNIHFGVNPRKGRNQRGDSSIVQARVFFADLDNCNLEYAQRRLETSGLPKPSAIVESGHGIHIYWRLAEITTDMEAWRDTQRAIAYSLSSDPKVCNPERLSRLPGFTNWKPPQAACYIVELNPEIRHAQAQFSVLNSSISIKSRPQLKIGKIQEGDRNQHLFSHGGKLRRDGWNQAEVYSELIKVNSECCQPPLAQAEVRTIAKNVSRYIPSASDGTSANRYFERAGCLWRNDGAKLTNFTARIVEEIIVSDGITTSKMVQTQITLGRRIENVLLSSADFRAMGWVIDAIPAAIIYPRSTEHVRCAIQELSRDIPKRLCFSHTGWLQYENQMIFLHAEGAISAAGSLKNVDVRLPPDLALYALPDPPSHDELAELVLHFKGLFELAPNEVILPLIAAIFRAPLGNCDFSLFITGATGVGKTQLFSIACQFFGKGLNAGNLPANYASTANALESLAFFAKDVFLAIDDYVPGSTRAEQQRISQIADRVIRGQGNRTGKQRMNKTLELQPRMYPRGLIGSTGEDLPPGHSLRARLLHLELKRGDIDFAQLTKIQDYASSGSYACIMSGYIQWLANQPDFQVRVREELPKYRHEFATHSAHRRTAEILGNLAIGFDSMLRFFTDVGAIDPEKSKAIAAKMRTCFSEQAKRQHSAQKEQDPVLRSIEALNAAIAANAAYLEPVGSPPAGVRQGTTTDKIGWYDDAGIYLIPLVAFRVAERMLGGPGSMNITEYQWRKHLNDRGYLIREMSKDAILVRKIIHGKQVRVLHLKPSSLGVS